MKIVFLLTQDLNSPSGLGRYLPMATELANHGHIVEIFALHPDYKNLKNKKKSVGSVNVKYVAPMHVRKIQHTKEYYSHFKLIWVGILATWALTIAALKSSADLITQAYIKTYNIPAIVTRFGNIYGPGDTHVSRIIPDIMKSVIMKKTLELRSDGNAVRDYVYVKDVARAYLFLLMNVKKTNRKVFNISSNDFCSSSAGLRTDNLADSRRNEPKEIEMSMSFTAASKSLKMRRTLRLTKKLDGTKSFKSRLN